MKKIFALLISFGTLTSVFAQGGHEKDNGNGSRDYDYKHQDNRNVYNNNEYDGHYSYSSKERDADIKVINHDYDDQIRSVRKDRRMRPDEKNRQIAMLDRQRDQRIQQIRPFRSKQKSSLR